ncbi:hypothetical protein GH808_04295 [Acetobacterium fimetarium]|uniref:DUF2284 domain-containing protein n=1 Tax=Acetobacterium fimetarium TaxID=52691 RepID=A0ABR6WTD8_9FIRM|nr:DUF2284 domain-containing protein [Acetobacterium fimetarium]MBC3803653.1 hypothetical protein [Acetobacterium fimetarium]
MELKNKLSFGAKRVEYLMEEYFDREKTLGYCKQCPNFSKYWSCPTYIFDEAIFLKQFKYMHIIGRQFEVPRDDIRNIRDPKEISRYCTEKLDAMKVMTWKTLLEIENEVEGAIGLIPGNCPICEIQKLPCARKSNQPCRNPGLMRYSLESLGFDVASLVKYEVGMTLEWPENMRLPKVLTSVSAILCNEEIPKEILRKYFPDKKKSWVKYAPDQYDTGFHVSEKIKPSETIHGKLEEVKATAQIIDDEIPPYRPQKSWVGYKAERNPEDAPTKMGWTVTVQGEETTEPEKTPEEVAAEQVFEEDTAPEVKEEVIVVAAVPEETAEPEPELEEEDDSQYRWLGFKAKADDDEFLKRPIRKMSELVLDGEEAADPEKASADVEEPEPEAVEAAPPAANMPVAEETIVPEVASEEVIIEAAAKETDETEPVAEEDDSKYQWLGFKTRVDDEEEPIVTKNTLSTLNIPE